MAASSHGWLARLSLATAEAGVGAAFGRSRLLGGLWAALIWAHERLAGAIAGSLLARHAEWIAVGAVGLVFLASPFVGTGVNALLVLLALAAVGLRVFTQPDNKVRFSSLDLAVIVFIGVHFIATGFSPFLGPSLKGLAKMMIYWAAYVSFRQVLQNRRSLHVVVGALLAAGTIEASYGIYQWIVGVEPLANWEDPEALNPLTRVYSTLRNPNLLAAYLLPIFPLAATAAIVWKNPWRFLGLACALVSPVCIWFTYSRGAYLAIAASVGLYALLALSLAWPWLKRSRKAMAGAFAVLAAGVGLVAWRVLTTPGLYDRIASIFTLRGHSSNSFRMNVWIGVWQMVQDSWLTGVGIGNAAFRKMYSLYMVSGYEALGAYNIFFEVLAEMGVIGLGAFLWLLLAFTARNLYTFWSGTGARRWWAASILAALAALVTMGMTDTVFYRPSVQLQFWLLLAMTIALSPMELPPQHERDSAN